MSKKSPVLEKTWADGEPAALAGMELVVGGMQKGGRLLAIIPDPVFPADVAASSLPRKKNEEQRAIVCVDLRKMKKAMRAGGMGAGEARQRVIEEVESPVQGERQCV